MKYVNPVKRLFSANKNTADMPFGHPVYHSVDVFDGDGENEEVFFIATQWLPPNAGVNRYENANKGRYTSNTWIKIPSKGKFFIYEHTPNDQFSRLFDTNGYNGEEPDWECIWENDRLLVKAMHD